MAPGMGSPDGLADFPGYCRWFPLILRKFLCVGEGSVSSTPQHLCPIPIQAQKACRRSAGPMEAQYLMPQPTVMVQGCKGVSVLLPSTVPQGIHYSLG